MFPGTSQHAVAFAIVFRFPLCIFSRSRCFLLETIWSFLSSVLTEVLLQRVGLFSKYLKNVAAFHKYLSWSLTSIKTGGLIVTTAECLQITLKPTGAPDSQHCWKSGFWSFPSCFLKKKVLLKVVMFSLKLWTISNVHCRP